MEPTIETETNDLSSQGFYCRVPKPCTPGEILDFAILIPRDLTNGMALCLRGRAVVIRIDRVGPNRFGMGCRFERYAIKPAGPRTRIFES